MFQDPKVAFMFTGQGVKYSSQTGSQLYKTFPVFQESMNECASILNKLTGTDIISLLFTSNVFDKQPQLLQPALFSLEYSLAKLWMYYGLKPFALVGHSLGEYLCACISGVMSLEDSLKLMYFRGNLMQKMQEGMMLSIILPQEEVMEHIKGNSQLSLALVNAPKLSVVAGPPKDIAKLEETLKSKSIRCNRLPTTKAFHSSLVDPILEEYGQYIRKIKLNKPIIPYLSNLTGTWIKDTEAIDPEYYIKHMRNTVKFADNVNELFNQPGCKVLLEIGPTGALTSLTKRTADLSKLSDDSLAIIPTFKTTDANDSESKEIAFFLESVAQLWLHGAPVQLEKQYATEQRRRVPLPTYCWQKKRHFVEPLRSQPSLTSSWDSPHTPRTPRTPRLDHTLSPRSTEDLMMRLVTMKSLWLDILGISTVTASSNFFEIGGTSLQGMQLVAKIRETFQIHLRLEEFYDKPTIENVLNVIDTKKSNPTAPMTPALNRTKRRGPIPTSYSQQRIWFMEQYYPGNTSYHI